MADRVLVSGAAFYPGDDPHHEFAALCDTSECLVCHAGMGRCQTMFRRGKVRAQKRFYPELILEVALPSS